MKNLRSGLLSVFLIQHFPVKRLLFLALVLLVLLGSVQYRNIHSFNEKLVKFQKEVDSIQSTNTPVATPRAIKIEPKDILLLRKDLISIEKDKVNAENAIYGNLVQALGGIFFFVTAYFAWRNVKTAESNLRATEEKQVTERFGKAIEHLASDKLEIRLGGIYALERIAKDSEKDYWTIMEVLSSFVKSRSPTRSTNQEQLEAITADIQGALTVIGRRNFNQDQVNKPFDLSNISLVRANLRGIDLRKTDLRRSDFSEAYLGGANLSGADLSGANLTRVNPTSPNSTVGTTNFSGAFLANTNMTEARLSRSDFSNADVCEANLKNAFLSKAKFIGTELVASDLSEADLSGVDFSRANLSGAKLSGANIHGAILVSTNGISVNQIKSAESWENAKYSEDFHRELGLS